MKKVLFFVLFTVSVIQTAYAATFHVSTTGSNSNTCVQAQNVATPKLTVNAGLACLTANAGDVLYLRGGTYNSGVDWHAQVIPGGTSWENATVIASYPGESAILRPTSPVSSAVIAGGSAQYIVFDRLVVDAFFSRYGMAAGNFHRFQYGEIKNSGGSRTPSVPFNPGQDEAELVEMFGSDSEVLYSELHHTTHSYGFYISVGQRNKVHGNSIHDCGGFAIQIYDGGFPTSSVNDTVISNNVMYNNGYFRQYGAITLGSGANNQVINNVIHSNYGGIWVYKRGTNTRIYNNTLYNNTNWGILVYFEATTAYVQNNILYQNGGSADDSGDTVYSNNLCGTAQTGCTVIGNPLFVNAGAANFRLQSTSPAKDTGVTIATFNGSYYDGVVRPSGAAWDIGAAEFSAGGNEAPSVNITAPAGGAVVSGSAVSVTANASDDVVVLGVQFKLDGANLGAEDTSAPFAIAWNTTGSVDGVHSLTAVARDASTTTTSSPVSITVQNAVSGVFYVAPTGSDARSCTTAQDIAQPKQTLLSGVSCLTTAGSTLVLREGSYAQSLVTNVTPIVGGSSWDVPTVIKSYDGETAVLQATVGSPVVLFLNNGAADHYIVFDRIVVDGLGVVGSNGLAVMSNSHHVRFQNGVIRNTYYEPVYLLNASYVELLTSTIHGGQQLGLIMLDGTTTIVAVEGNVLHTAPLSAIQGHVLVSNNVFVLRNVIYGVGVSGSVGAVSLASDASVVANNVVYGSYRGVVVNSGAGGLEVYNNTITENSNTAIVVSSGAVNTQVVNNVVYNNGAAVSNSGTGTVQGNNLESDPLFVNAMSHDYRLLSGSPARNSGASLVAIATAVDFNGVVRPQEGVYDIGAFEFESAVISGSSLNWSGALVP